MAKKIAACFLWFLWSIFLFCPGFAGVATAGDSTARPAWGKAFFTTPAAELLAAANAVPAPDKGGVIVLMEEGNFTFDAEGRCISRYRTVYRILTQAGAKEWAAISWGWAPWFQERPVLRARVVSPDGVEHLLSPETISDAPERQDSSTVYSDRRVVQAPLPAVAVGAVVEQEVTVRENSPSFSAGSVHRFNIGNRVRTLGSRVTIEYPNSLPILHKVTLLPEVAVSRSQTDGRTCLTFEVSPTEPIEQAEPGIPGDVSRWPNVAFTAGRSWSEVGARYGEIVDRQIATSELAALVREAVGDAKERDKIAARLLARLRKNVRYTGIEFGSASIVPRSPEETLRQKYGDCKDQAALLVKMLRTAGIPANVALLRSDDGEDVDPDLPGLGGFNHAIVYVPGKFPLWIDPTAETRPAGELPLNDQGRRALIAGSPFTTLIDTPEAPSTANRQEETREFILSETGKSRVIETSWMSGSLGALYRSGYRTSDQKSTRKTLEDYARNAYLSEKLAAFETSDPNRVDEPFRIRLEMNEATRGLTDENEAVVAIFSAFLTGRLPSELTEEGKEGAAKRKGDFLLHEPYVYEVRYRIVPPPGFRVQTLPESDATQLGPMVLSREYSVGEDGAVSALLRFDTVKRRLTPAEFEAVKAAVKKLKDEKTAFVRFEQVGRALLAAGKFSEALAEFRRLSVLHPQEALHHVQIAEVLLAMGLRDAALKEAERAVTIEPNSAMAHRTVAWILQHDVIGRRTLKGIDRKRALAEYRRAKALDPADSAARGDLAILLEYDENGERYGRNADLADAIAEYRALRTDLKRNELDDNLLVCLYRTERWKELKELALSLDAADTGNLYVILAVAGEEGAPAALKEARRRIPDPANRRKTLDTVASSLILVRHYQDAADLLEEAAKGASNAVSLRERANLLRKAKRFDQVPLPDGELTTVVKRMLISLFVPESAPDTLVSLFARHIREEMAKGNTGAVLQDLNATMDKTLKSVGGPPREVVVDITINALDFHVDGNDAAGYRIDAVNPAFLGETKLRLYAVKEEGKYRIVTGYEKPGVLGLEALRRIEAGDFASAKTWLDWARDDVSRTRDDDPLSEVPFLRVWKQGSPADPERMRVAAACLISDMKDKKVIPILLKGRETAEGDLKGVIDIALAKAYTVAKKYPELLQVSDRLRDAYPQSIVPLADRAYALRMMNRWDEVRAMAEERLGKMPKDPPAIRVLASCAEQKGDFAEAGKWYKVLVEAGTANAEDYNNLAWLDLFGKSVSPEALTFAERAVSMSGGKDESYLHTLSALYAEAGRLGEARETILKTMEVSDRNEPESRHWYVLGRIAEQYGEKEAATEAYRKVTPPRPEEVEANSTYALARKRLGPSAAPIRAGQRKDLQAGIVKKESDGTYVVVKETTKIPFVLKTEDPDFIFGFVAPSGSIEGTECYKTVTLPKPKTIKYSVNGVPMNYDIASENGDRIEIKEPTIFCKDGFYAGIRFDEGDQPGLYQVKIYADGALVKTIDFDVVKK